ncbi:MAG: hypothetical protein KAS96_04555, partial [Planctomycetes bacterium]|nr:hypothetical protein [Planctomycetota bacterium]
HNLIDFAIFEPSVYTALWVMIAALIALNLNNKPQNRVPKKLPIYIKILLIIPIVILTLASLVFGFYWPVKADSLVKTTIDKPYDSARLLKKASQVDPLNTIALSMFGKFFMYQYSSNPARNPGSLANASESFCEAALRDPADYKNYEKLVDIYALIARKSQGDLREENLKIALGYAEKAAELYPGSARIRFKYALVADQLKMTNLAISQYMKAIEIEDSFAGQFKTMYPGRDVVSRLGREQYNQAKGRVEQLMQK